MNKIKAVLLDYDGVLTDTPEDNFNGWKHAFKIHANINISSEDYFLIEGARPEKIAQIIGEKYGIKRNLYKRIIITKEIFYQENNNFSLYPGIWDLLLLLRNNKILMALVSGSSRGRLYKTTPDKIINQFKCIITADDITCGKPDPDPYLLALAKLDVDPQDALVIENAPLGIESAKSAGIYCIAVGSTLGKKFLTEADETINDFTSLKKRLEELISA